ncbi:FAD-binding oxidoreductase [Cohnella endophytica]|uniref:FAD-binding oxidoreductase n=1 Tax=Cohnella endophytica TaxID=2419778 RepID=A0A494XCH3_9BACL|nr:FAD-dependent oxidoreductase [Cohnella endophytica]RKP45839.1 FAD-binding oxidoreductase [Cohnella endophytica]
MSLHFGHLFWPTTHPRPRRYPALDSAKRTRAVIIGGGMSGITCGYALAGSGIDAVLIEQGYIAAGSTSSNTGLLQYSNDTMLSEFAETIGEEKAVTFYKACGHASERLHVIAERLPRDVQFKKRSSLYYASTPKDVPALRKEYEILNKHGFGAEWWDEDKIISSFPFRKSAAIVTNGDAEVNPFLFVHSLADEAYARGLSIHENTLMLSVEPAQSGYVVRTTGGDIHAEHVIYAVGYAPEQAGGRWVKAKLNRSYAIVTDSIPSLADWHERFMLWETARPYLYARTTTDDRIVVGGLDENVRQPILTERDLLAHSLRLLSELKLLFPNYEPRIRYEWCATFGESEDGLPWIGEDPDRPGQHYLLGYGGNGTIYSMLGAEIIRDRLLGIDNPIASIVRPDRHVVIPGSGASSS